MKQKGKNWEDLGIYSVFLFNIYKLNMWENNLQHAIFVKKYGIYFSVKKNWCFTLF